MRATVIASGTAIAFTLACGGGVKADPEPVPSVQRTPTISARRISPPKPDDVPPIAGGCEIGTPKVSLVKGVFTATICPNISAAGPVYVGVTVQSEQGAWRDLPYATVPLDKRGELVTIRESIPDGFERWIGAIWGKEIDCGKAPSPSSAEIPADGCARFGKVLDELSWGVEGIGSDGEISFFEEILPVRVQILDSGGGSAAVSAAKTAVAALVTKEHPAPPTTDGGVAQKQRDYIEILYKRDRFRPLADQIRAALPKDQHYVMTLWREAPEAVVVAIGR